MLTSIATYHHLQPDGLPDARPSLPCAQVTLPLITTLDPEETCTFILKTSLTVAQGQEEATTDSISYTVHAKVVPMDQVRPNGLTRWRPSVDLLLCRPTTEPRCLSTMGPPGVSIDQVSSQWFNQVAPLGRSAAVPSHKSPGAFPQWAHQVSQSTRCLNQPGVIPMDRACGIPVCALVHRRMQVTCKHTLKWKHTL